LGAKPEIITVSALLEMRKATAPGQKYFLEIPTFQRGLVWSEQKKKDLVSSIYKSFPIGSLLVYESSNKTQDGRRTKIQIIDGLQRSTAMLDYATKPLRFAPVAEILVEEETYESILKIVQTKVSKATKAQIRDAIDSWANKTEETLAGRGFQSSNIRSEIEKKFEFEFESAEKDELENLLSAKVIDRLTAEFNKIFGYQVPVIFYSGPEEDLPEIFESLNSGTPLTKYDKFGATWSNHTTVTKNAAIREAIKDRYSVYIDKGWEVQNYDPTQNLGENDLNLFEYLTGLGKVLSDNYPQLFDQIDKHSEPSANAFVLATVAHGLRIGDMGKLPSKITRNGSIDLTKFEAALMDACQTVNDKLKIILALKLNQRNPADRFLPHSANQVLSLVLRVLIEKYDSNTWAVKPGANQLELLKSNMLVHYVKDIISEAWRGSGDSTLYERVWIKNDATDALTLSSYYLLKPSKADITAVLDLHQEAELSKRQTTRGNQSTKSKLLLRVLYTDIITHKDNVAVQFDIEHLCPVKAMSNLIAAKNITEGLPISCLGNLAILPTPINIIKGENYVGDYMASHSGEFDVERTDKTNSYVITPLAEVILESKIQSETEFLDFVTTRFTVQKDLIIRNLGFSE
jgi:hypothetical protein